MAELSVLIRSHHFKVTQITPRARPAVDSFARRFVQYGLERVPGGRFVKTAMKVFGAATADRSEYRFHINTYPAFLEHLKSHYLEGNLVEIIEEPPPEPRKVELPIFPQWTDREHQVPFIEYLVAPEPLRKLGAIQTGKGKSYSSMRAASILGEVLVAVIKPKYMDKWVEDFRKTYDITADDLMVVRGSDHLMGLLLLAVNGELDAKVIMISNKTLQNWLKLYEKFRDETLQLGYACLPEELFGKLQAGIRLIDEVHEDFHLNFKIDMYTNVKKSISLSATLIPDDPFLKQMCEVAYPARERYVGEAYHKYIAAHAVIYRTRDPNKIRWKEPGSANYSHYAYEKYVMRYKDVLQNYLKLIEEVIIGGFLNQKDRKPGHRCLVFCSLIDMCTLVVDYLKKRYPNKDIRRYMENDPYENLVEPEIIVSSLQNAGTGQDIPGLFTVILTIGITSSQGNVQGFGRLRELKGDLAGTPHFYYLVNEDCRKHVEYHEKKKELLRDKALTYNTIHIALPI
jgi:hypothetical protein